VLRRVVNGTVASSVDLFTAAAAAAAAAAEPSIDSLSPFYDERL